MAQNNDEIFGKSRIQYRSFDWRFYSTPHFDVYYYQGGQKLAKHVAEYIEEEYNRITDIMGYAPYIKTKVFIYNSNIDLTQSNVGIKEATFDIGGQTNFLKTHVELAFEGSITEFEENLVYKVSKLFIDDMLFGGLISEVFQSTYLFTVPDWFVEGIAAYIAYGWNAEMDDFARDFLMNNSTAKIKRLSGKEARLAGQAIWNFTSEKYGRINISNILNLTRIIRNEERSIPNTLGLPYKAFLNEFRFFYINNISDQEKMEPIQKNQLSKPWKKNLLYKPTFSPDGNWLAYSINDNGKFKVRLRNLNSGKEKTILKGGIKRLDNKFYENIPVMDWGDSATLGIVTHERGVNLLKLYNPYSKDLQTRDLRKFDQVNQMDIYPNGKTAVISANINGQSDLYLVSTGRPNIRRLTNDVFDDLHPAFIPDTKRIIFSSNRSIDSLSIKYGYERISENFNLFEYDIDHTKDTVKRLTNDFGINTQVKITDSSNYYFLSDKSGIFNLYQYNTNKKVIDQVTSFNSSIQSFDILPKEDKFSFVLNKGKGESLYYYKDFEPTEARFLPSTLRKQVELSRRLAESQKNKQSTKPLNNDSRFSNDSITSKELNPKDSSEIAGRLNADDFNFEGSAFNPRPKESSLLKNLNKLRKRSSLNGPYEYSPTFTADNVVVSFLIDPLIGFAPYLEYQMNDLMENNKFFGGVTVSSRDFKSGKVFGEYQHLSRLFDYSVRFERKVLNFMLENRTVDQTYSLNSLTFGISYPFSTTSRLSLKPHVLLKNFTESSDNILNNSSSAPLAKNPIQNDVLFGGKIEYIYDNSEPKGLNIREGLRAKAVFENYTSGFGKNQSFSKLYVDFRNYQKVFREITFATRLYGGGFFGGNSPYFMLGGVNNWLGQNINRPEAGETTADQNPLALTTTENPTDNSNILFHEFVTGLRGFRLNEFSGKNVILLSNELRIPLFRVLSNEAISSSFLRNFQIIGFYDIGTAWLGGTPWDDDNSINKQIINNGNKTFRAVIRNYKNPWLSSVGMGLRTTLFGYFVRIDYAYPIEDYVLNEPKFQISIGYDF
ncbi:PD40 domain-containing protein [Marivirga sp. S37H4]|uniref:PD40 domain-containing protein n=1 Tax=Marivirga aurantiaca TaxID=2802615 RepID=A0A934X343_9BACT|nr:PD40 domain-containing protein [Marivirga aurantiaca]MBK6267376.1 PD40 domain-containing protein [Marivirga aurantiaca]